ncbi:MAG: hypothetical protein H6721_00945 [Sandaracinus sp.]|nr:hypothetical protein [Sandaracinus sp.]MCB9630710.1 hypothetical protein [Sandaracinus sp.]
MGRTSSELTYVVLCIGFACTGSPSPGAVHDATVADVSTPDAGGRSTPAEDATSPSADAGFCSGSGPIVELPVPSPETPRDTCAGGVAERVFTYALCACEDLSLAGFLQTRSRDSRRPGEDLAAAGAAVGINRDYRSSSYTDVGGSFSVAGPDGPLALAGFLDVRGDAAVASSIESAGYMSVARDAYVAGDIRLAGLLTVGRDLHQPAGRALAAVPLVSGRRVAEPVTVAAPCDCPERPRVDVRALTERARTDNDNARIGLDPRALEAVVGDVRQTLPCGRYHLTSIGGVGRVRFAVRGRVALFVSGDLESVGVVELDLAPDAEIDVFVGGTIRGVGWGRFGGGDRPAAVRLYVGGEDDITLVGAESFVANLYAPRARVLTDGAMFVEGSLFARAVEARGSLTVHYDRAIHRAGDDCPDPPPGLCEVCDGSCGSDACVEGECGTCRSDADCCAPSVCLEGSCQSLLI